MFLLIPKPHIIIVCSITNFTFHNVSINTASIFHCRIYLRVFTFHNVSINTRLNFKNLQTHCNFTFHNVSINTDNISTAFFNLLSLHSTMFLLIPWWCQGLWWCQGSLHSTMFLLILDAWLQLHNNQVALHSTMFLLIPGAHRSSCKWTWVLYIPQCFY